MKTRVRPVSYTHLIGPVDEDFKEGGLHFVDEVKGGNIPKEFIPSVQKGFTTAMKNGVLAGYPLDSLQVTLIDGSFHPVDSDQVSFEICAIQAYKDVYKRQSLKASPSLKGVVIGKRLFSRVVKTRSAKLADKALLPKIDDEFDAKIGDLDVYKRQVLSM